MHSDFARIIMFIILFGCVGTFEFVMNRCMRIPKYQSITFIFQIFSISVLSSFYSLFCTLDILKDEGFFGKSVSFKLFLFEHKLRIYFSAFINFINFVLIFVNGIDQSIANLLLMIVYIPFVILNILIVKRFEGIGSLDAETKS